MKAVLIDAQQNLVWADTEEPETGDKSVCIKVHATAINRADIMQRRGLYPPPPGASPVLGLECAGSVAALGKGATRYKLGDRVCALLTGGGYAQYAVADEGSVLPIPKGLTYAQAAALPEVFATAWLNIFMEANLQPGEKTIIHAGASGVGTAAIQLCKAFSSPSFVTCGADNKLDACIALGAQAGSNRHVGSFLPQAAEFAKPDGVAVILDPVGAAYLADNIQLLGLGGRLVLIGLMSGAQADIDLAQLLVKRIRIIGSTLRARQAQEKAVVMTQLEKKVWPLIERGDIIAIVDRVFAIEDVAAAHEWVTSDNTIGKVVLNLSH